MSLASKRGAALGPIPATTAPTRMRTGLHRPTGQELLLGALLLVSGYLVLPPLVVVVQTSFLQSDQRGLTQPTLANYLTLFDGAALAAPLLNTVLFALGSTSVALLLGGSLAWLVARTNAPFRALGQAAMFASFAVPYILYTIAWLFVLGRGGPVNAALMSMFGLPGPPINPYTLPAMILIEGLLWSPLSFLMSFAVFQAIDPSFEESATMSGAGSAETIRRVTIPLAAPALLSIALLVFIRAFESFDIPALVGLPGHISVLSTGIYLRTLATPPDYGGASAFAVILMALVLVALQLYWRFTGQASRFATISGKAFRPRTIDLGRWRMVAGVAILGYAIVLLVVPLALLIWASLMPFYTRPSAEAVHLASLTNYVKVLSDPSFGTSLRNTLLAAGMAAVGVVAITAVASWLVVKSRVPGRQWLDQLASLPLVFPSIVLGLAYLQLYLRVPLPVYNTLWILGLAFIARFLPYGMRYISGAMTQLHSELEEAAAVSGASFRTSYRRVVLPLLAPVLLGTFLFVFMISTKELSMSVLLSGPRTQVMAVLFFQQWNGGQATEVAAFGVLWAAALSVITIGLFLIGRRFGLQFQPR